jgi:hypothetical protein
MFVAVLASLPAKNATCSQNNNTTNPAENATNHLVRGVVSLLMNVSWKLVCSELPAFMTMVPGTSAMAVGISWHY